MFYVRRIAKINYRIILQNELQKREKMTVSLQVLKLVMTRVYVRAPTQMMYQRTSLHFSLLFHKLGKSFTV